MLDEDDLCERRCFFPEEFERVSERLSPQARSLWAKTGRGEQSHLWEPLYVHMGDSGEIARLLWSKWLPRTVKKLIAQDLSDSAAESLVAWMASVHDIGKATPAFQYKVTDRAESVRETGLEIPAGIDSKSHAFMGQVILEDWLFDRAWSHPNIFSCVVGGHHGAPPDSSTILDNLRDSLFPKEVLGESTWTTVQIELLDYAFVLSGAFRHEEELKELELPQHTQVLLTALVIMSDWIASNADLLPLVSGIASTADFRARAREAWERLALPAAWVPSLHGEPAEARFHARFDNIPEAARLRPAQILAVEAAESLEDPGLIIIEAPMGNGKTEASLLCAEILAEKFGSGGIAYLLPTMATSNAMFSRVENWLSHMADADGSSRQSMQLLHSKSALNKDFASLRTWNHTWMGDERNQQRSKNPNDENIIAHQWFGGRKRGLLASFVVGTVDQLLMAALKAKHVQLRHLGLAGKVVVIDEVHAYDAYMSVYLDRVMTWLGAYRVPTVLLSATLPPQRRKQLIRAYRGKDARSTGRPSKRRLIDPPRRATGEPAYPLVTVSGRDLDSERYCDCEVASRGTDVEISFLLDGDDDLLATLRDRLSDGGCACVLRDTVSRAQETYEFLKTAMDAEVRLVHSRFIAADRLSNDAELLKLLGPNASRRPRSLVVVGTQVIEQSLDIDFDFMITDIAPIDLLLQRMGRLHRHQRGEGQSERSAKLRTAQCFITGSKDWSVEPPEFDKGIIAVYHPALLLRTILALKVRCDGAGGSRINLPHDIAGLVETVYEGLEPGSNDFLLDGLKDDAWRDALLGAQDDLRQYRMSQESKASNWLLGKERTKPGKVFDLVGWLGNRFSISDEETGRAAVRDSQESLEVVALHCDAGNLSVFPWVALQEGVEEKYTALGDGTTAPDDCAACLAATCTVPLPPLLTKPWRIAGIVSALESATNVSGWQESRWLKGQLPLVFDRNGVAVVDCERERYHLGYSRELGLRLLEIEHKEVEQ